MASRLMPVRFILASMVALSPTALAACAAERAGTPAPVAAAASILHSSEPAANARVTQPLDRLMLHFSPPARLDEVTVAGPDGTMPMMITAVGEQAHYSIPLPALGPGAYTVGWRATAGGVKHSGSFAITVE